jgi:hypothetical protein
VTRCRVLLSGREALQLLYPSRVWRCLLLNLRLLTPMVRKSAWFLKLTGLISTGRSPADFELGVSSLYLRVPSYTALFNWNSVVFRRLVPWGVPSYTTLYLALRRKQPPRKPLNFAGAAAELRTNLPEHRESQIPAQRAIGLFAPSEESSSGVAWILFSFNDP